MANDSLKEALQLFAVEYINELANQLRRRGKYASGDLIRSLESRIIKTAMGTDYTLEILANDYLKFVDEGRRPGKQPPLRAIQRWVRIKGINPKAAYPIARKIGEKGIKATNVIENALKEVNSQRGIRIMQDGMSDWVDDMVDQMLLNISKNKNITIKI